MLAPEGELGRAELAELRRDLERLAAVGARRVVLELSGVSHADYRGLPGLLSAVQAVQDAGGEVLLRGGSAYVRAIFRVGGFGAAPGAGGPGAVL